MSPKCEFEMIGLERGQANSKWLHQAHSNILSKEPNCELYVSWPGYSGQ